MFPSNLIKVTPTFFGDLDSRSKNTLGRLPNLQNLKLLEGTILDSLNCAAGEFPQLQVLILMTVKSQKVETRERCNDSSSTPEDLQML